MLEHERQRGGWCGSIALLLRTTKKSKHTPDLSLGLEGEKVPEFRGWLFRGTIPESSFVRSQNHAMSLCKFGNRFGLLRRGSPYVTASRLMEESMDFMERSGCHSSVETSSGCGLFDSLSFKSTAPGEGLGRGNLWATLHIKGSTVADQPESRT
jgi:hypothetical protein